MSSPEDPQTINPPNNTTQDPSTQPSPDLSLTDEEENLSLTDPDPTPPPPINPPDNT
jgi:hypothetical protein